MTRHQHDITCAIAFGVTVVVVTIAGIIFGIANATHIEYRTCTVTEKDRTRNSQGSSDARIYTADCGTLRVADSLFEGTWTSADTYAKIKPGQRYDFKTRGYRVPFFSMFPNIVGVTATP